MLSPSGPTRRPPRRARVAMLLFVLPMLIYSAATRSAEEGRPPAGATDGLTAKHAGEQVVYAVCYAVDDLLNPIRRTPAKVTSADFAALTERIKQQVVPGTWGPVGEITPYPENLSLVISHHEAGHAAVKAFLTRLRNSAASDP